MSVVARIKDAGGWGVGSWEADECGGGGGAQTAEGGQAEELLLSSEIFRPSSARVSARSFMGSPQ